MLPGMYSSSHTVIQTELARNLSRFASRFASTRAPTPERMLIDQKAYSEISPYQDRAQDRRMSLEGFIVDISYERVSTG